ncbi:MULTISPECIES: rhodanese-like domain-containing protein [unclassified Romboutsia]|uniref:rhodanese-like domain-containing protein n=1 Tax=unclassified Romboutsia TaxID=2626894 RepID=UPI0008217534|nr:MULTISPECIES: rhodanese-like domain-containing protein [unclassified Romboutsia]SCI20179.1 Thiosulfate sulfurtransferase PspE precursor [uncultured Clostridium sp.]
MNVKKIVKSLSVGMLLVLAIGGLVGCSSNKGEVGYNKIDSTKTEKLADENENVLVIDVRDEENYIKGHLANAINIPFDEFEGKISELEIYKDQKILLICHTGNKSGKAAKMLIDNGFTKVYNAEDGMDEFDYKTVDYTNVTGNEFEKLVEENKDAFILDVRDAKDYDKGSIKNAVNIPIDEVESRLNEIDDHKDEDILIYCSIGRRSAQVAELLKDKGFKNVVNSVDGVKEYDFNLVK